MNIRAGVLMRDLKVVHSLKALSASNTRASWDRVTIITFLRIDLDQVRWPRLATPALRVTNNLVINAR